jgi:hypothetical protein
VRAVTQKLAEFEALFVVHLGNPTSEYPLWKSLVQSLDIRGTHVHDTRLVAFMIAHHIPNILTFNTKDFIGFNDITVRHPDDYRVKI